MASICVVLDRFLTSVTEKYTKMNSVIIINIDLL